MEIAKLKKFAQFARRSLIEQISAKLKLVLVDGSVARREKADAIRKLDEQIKQHGKEQVIERIAYIWFNRFCALRFMDVNRYTHIGVVSPAEVIRMVTQFNHETYKIHGRFLAKNDCSN